MTDKSGYTIMFGPDTCGADKKMHFIMRHKHPKTGEYSEKHSKKPSGKLDFYTDKQTHLFRLTVQPSNDWEVSNHIVNLILWLIFICDGHSFASLIWESKIHYY